MSNLHNPEDQTVSQDAYKVGHIVEEIGKDFAKLTTEALMAAIRFDRNRIKVKFNTVEDSINNVQRAMGLGATKEQLRAVVDAHTSAKTIARNNPDRVRHHQDFIIKAAERRSLVQSQQDNPGFKQQLAQAQQQQQKLSQTPSFGM